ncbi:MAG: DUF4091 domain-containing protein, partial [Lentisphaeria bacterium]|nr:DUF4091 domain-containing protein [Lentisphaeria bacterium]
VPHLDQWIIHSSATSIPERRKMFDRFKVLSGKKTGIYMCGTNMRQDCYRYYRLLPWNVLEAGADFVSLYQLFPQSMANDLYRIPFGDAAYVLPDTVLPSVRLEFFRMGMTDVRYLRLLEKLASGNSKQDREDRDFVRKAAHEVYLVSPHDAGLAGKMREEAIRRILKRIK